jgi:thiol-disulfide isomerase/thioredoxin
MRELTYNDLVDLVKGDLPVLVMVGASWCDVCSSMKWILKRASEDFAGGLEVGTIDADLYEVELEDREEFENVEGYPTFFLFKKNKARAWTFGKYNKRQFYEWLLEAMKK